MGYRDDFYIVDNIIGYTGRVNRSPTVYFLCGQESGHITQYHSNDANCGRETVHSDPHYYHQNDPNPLLSNRITFHEKWPSLGHHGRVHWSRNPMIFLANINADDLAVLSQAIWLYTEKKEYSVDDPVPASRPNPHYLEGQSRVASLRALFSR
jgi:hypothetical protein